jgi:MoaA/NifB/PqqE/SkfB family radical SAM enzyme
MVDTICMLPWESFTVTMKNTIRPCCRFPTQEAVDMSDYENAFRQLREDMLAGKVDSRCSKCFEEEAAGNPSMRTAANEFHGLEFKKEYLTSDFRKLTHIELSLDNTCNLQCRMCSSQFSSKLLKRDKFLTLFHEDLDFHVAKVQKSRYETLKDLKVDWSELRSVKLLGGEPFLSPNFLDFLYFLDMRTDISQVQLEIVTNCTTPMTDEMAEILNEFKFIRLSGSFDGLPKHSEYQRVGSNWYEAFDNFKQYGELLKNRRMTVHQTFTVFNVDSLDEAIEFYEPYCETQSWSYDDYQFSFLHAPDWFEEWVLSKNDNKKLRNIFKKRKYDHIKWHRLLNTISVLDDFHELKLEDHNPELAHMLKINTKRYVDAHKRPATRDCMYCDLVDEKM